MRKSSIRILLWFLLSTLAIGSLITYTLIRIATRDASKTEVDGKVIRSVWTPQNTHVTGQQVVRVVFAPPAPFLVPEVRSFLKIDVLAWYGEQPWSMQCDLEPVPNTSTYACEFDLRENHAEVFGQIRMVVPCGMDGCEYNDTSVSGTLAMRFWGDLTDTPCGGHGKPLGDLSVSVDGKVVAYDFTDPATIEPCSGERCNFHFKA